MNLDTSGDVFSSSTRVLRRVHHPTCVLRRVFLVFLNYIYNPPHISKRVSDFFCPSFVSLTCPNVFCLIFCNFLLCASCVFYSLCFKSFYYIIPHPMAQRSNKGNEVMPSASSYDFDMEKFSCVAHQQWYESLSERNFIAERKFDLKRG